MTAVVAISPELTHASLPAMIFTIVISRDCCHDPGGQLPWLLHFAVKKTEAAHRLEEEQGLKEQNQKPQITRTYSTQPGHIDLLSLDLLPRGTY